MPVKSLAALLCAWAAVACGLSGAAADDVWTARLVVRGQTWEGRPLHKDDQRLYLLARDGRLLDFRPSEVADFQKLGSGFSPYSQAELRGQLAREFGQGYDVSGTGHYLVVHPAGRRDEWAERFEDLYRSYVHYFTARGVGVRQPQFPLVAVVFANRAEFAQFAAREGPPPSSGVLGYYSPQTNRILLYDQGASSGGDWRENAAVVIHEATHQMAFNTGLHSRFGPPPRWVAEGLATMFEARGVYDSGRFREQSERINAGRLADFRRYAATRRKKGALAEFVSSDRPYQADPGSAYAEGWALTFFLAENEPRKYAQLLSRTALLPPFSSYEAPKRLKDFSDILGPDLGMLEARMLRFVGELK